MNAGLPGMGIGGLFYLLTALMMPLFELVHTARGNSGVGRWRNVARQTGMAMLIIGAMGAVSWALSFFVAASGAGSSNATGIVAATSGATAVSVVRFAQVFLTVGVLAGVLLTVEMASLVMSRPPQEHQIGS